MISALEKIVVLSLAIIKAAQDSSKNPQENGLRIQRLNERRLTVLRPDAYAALSTENGDEARIALIQYLGQAAAEKIRQLI